VSALAPVPQGHDPIERATGKIAAVWARWFNELKARAEQAIAAGSGEIDASQITSGTIDLARLANIVNAQISIAAAIAWAKIDKAGSSLADLAARSASDLTSGLLALARGGTGADLSATGAAGHYVKQSSAGAALSVGAIAAGDLPTGIDAAKIADGTVSNTEFQYIGGLTSDAQTQLDRRLQIPNYRKWMSYSAVSGAAGTLTVQALNTGGAAVSASGQTDITTATFTGYRLTTAAGAGAVGSILGASNMCYTLSDPTVYVRMKTGSDITGIRLYFGLTSAAFTNADTHNLHYVAFRYSTVVPDGGWVGVCCDGTAANAQTTATVANIAADTEYTLRIRVSADGTAVAFAVSTAGGAFSAEQSLSANLPSTSTKLQLDHRVIQTGATAGRAWIFNSSYVELEAGS
jgi:hypothetical protein